MTAFKSVFPLVMLMAGCAATPESVETIVPVPAQAGTTTTLKVGQVLEIVQQGNASTGYAWEFTENGAPVLRQAALPSSGKAADEAASGPPVVGAPSTYRWHYQAAEPGEATVRMVYRRPWEKDAKPAREAEYRVVVSP